MADYCLFSDADWPRLEQDWNAWWAGELERPMVVLETHERRQGVEWEAFDAFLTQFPSSAAIDDLLAHSDLLVGATHYYADAYPKWDCNFGAGNVAAFLGASWEHNHDTRTTWFHGAPSRSIADISVQFDPANAFWERILATTKAAIGRWGQQAAIGYADLGGNLDVLASLRGTQNLLYDLYDAPDEVESLCSQVTDAWLRYYDQLDALTAPTAHGSTCWAPLWAPSRTYILQSDFSYMVGPKVFERFVLPDLERCCAALGYPFYHMDGKGQLVNLDLLLSIDKLRGIQWQPGDGVALADEWPDVLHRIRAGGKLCQIYVDRAGAFRVAREHGGKGFVFSIVEYLSDDEASEFLQAFRREFVGGT